MSQRKTRYDYAAPGSFDRVLEAAIALADADSDDDVVWHRARLRHRKAEEAHFLALGWRPPSRARRHTVAVESLSFGF